MKIIFCDFDGCLNSYAEGSHVTNKDETYGPSKTICERLRRFCERTNSKIVISSNWRKFELDGNYTFNGNKVMNPLVKLYGTELRDHIIGILPRVRHITKAEALILWFEENDIEIDGYVIFDDDVNENFQTTHDHGICDHFILVDPEFGITDEILENAEKILKKDK